MVNISAVVLFIVVGVDYITVLIVYLCGGYGYFILIGNNDVKFNGKLLDMSSYMQQEKIQFDLGRMEKEKTTSNWFYVLFCFIMP